MKLRTIGGYAPTFLDLFIGKQIAVLCLEAMFLKHILFYQKAYLQNKIIYSKKSFSGEISPLCSIISYKKLKINYLHQSIRFEEKTT